jgi:hypothetical protein
MIGVFSEKAAELFGTLWYKTPNGSEVEVTAVYEDGENAEGYGWVDKKIVGEVVEMTARAGRKGSMPEPPSSYGYCDDFYR